MGCSFGPFDALPPPVAQRQFQHELAKMHALSLCSKERRSPRRRRRYLAGDGERRTKEDARFSDRRPEPMMPLDCAHADTVLGRGA